MRNIFDKPDNLTCLIKDLIKSNNKTTLVRDMPITFIESYLSGLLMNNPVLTTDGLITLQTVSRKIVSAENLSLNILNDIIESIHEHGYSRFPPTEKDKRCLEQLYPVIRMGNHDV